jgi:hypothetical protein
MEGSTTLSDVTYRPPAMGFTCLVAMLISPGSEVERFASGIVYY